MSHPTVDECLAGKAATGIVVRNSIDYLRRTYSALEGGQVVVPLRSAQDTQRSTVFHLQQIEVPTEESGWLRLDTNLPTGADLALVAFTSGTEGQPKAILLTHDNLADVVTRLNRVMQVGADIREYVGVPVFHSFGFGRCRAVMAAGGAVYLPPRGFNPREIGDMLRSGEINALSAVPTLCRVLLENRQLIGEAGSKLRWMEIGSQYMSRSEKEQIRDLFPSAVIVQHYGLTEASRSTFLRIDAAGGNDLESVGSPLGQVQIRIEADGRIAIHGPHVASALVVGSDVVDPRGADGWLTTNDLGELKDGVLYFRGRADDVINCGGLKLYPELVERQIRESLGASAGIAVCRVPDPVRGEGVLVAYLHDQGFSRSKVLEAAQQVILDNGVSAAGAVHCIESLAFPFTENGKLQRRQLAAELGPEAISLSRQADAELADRATEIGRVENDAVSRIFAEAFPGKHIAQHESFVSLGGDSLTYVSVVLALEELIPELPRNWERMSVAELGRLVLKPTAAQSGSKVELEATILVRAIAPVLVVMNHAGETWLAGGAATLLAVVGMNFGRFQLQHLIEGRVRQVLAGFTINVLLPYWLILVGFQALKGQLKIADVLLFGNFVGTNTHAPFAVWFIQVVAQLMLILVLVLKLPRLRSIAATRPFGFAAALLAFACVMRLAEVVWFPELMINRGRELSWVAWLFALGLMIHASRTGPERIAASVCALALPLAFYWGDGSRIVLIALGCLVALWVPRLSCPVWLARIVGVVGAASMFIYMMHGRATNTSFTAGWSVDLIRISLGIALGVFTWWAYSAVVRYIQSRRRTSHATT